MKKLLVLFVVLALGVAASANAVTWNVPGGGTWSTASNWDTAVPSNGDAAVIPSAAATRTLTVDVQGVTYHATVGANLPATGSYTLNEQMYWIICDYPMLNFVYQNYTDWGASPGAGGYFNWTSDQRWRGNPNDSYRNVDISEGDFADFNGKYQTGNGLNGIDNDKNKKEDAVPTPQLTFDVPDLNAAGAPNLYIAHDVNNAGERPTWMAGYTDMGKQLHTQAGLTWDVFSLTLSSTTAATGDSTGWISDGGFLASLDLSQTTAGVVQTLTLAHNLAVSTVPTFNVTAGSVVVDIGSYWFQVPHLIVIPDGVTIQMDGGLFGKAVNDTSGASSSDVLWIQAGGTLSGTGIVNPGRGHVLIDEGGTLDVGNGTLAFNFPFGQTFKWRGAITGNGTSSILNLGYDANSTWQLKAIDPAGANASIDGIVTMIVAPNDDTMTFGRFADATKINLRSTTFDLRKNDFSWEAQTLTADVVDDPANIDFKLGALSLGANGIKMTLVDNGAVADDFVYIGQLQNLAATRRIDLNGIALLTDMTEAALNGILGFIDNTGAGGAPTVKTVTMYGNPGVMWYVAPATTEIPTPPPPGSVVIVR